MLYNYLKSRRQSFTLVLMLILSVGLLSGCAKDSISDSNDENEIEPLRDVAGIDFSQKNQVIRGFGGATVFRLNATLTDNDMDLLFGTSPGQIGFTTHRIRVVSDQDPDGRAIELNNARRAQERGAVVIASPWSPPARMKTNNSLIGGSLKPESYGEYAAYLNDFAEYMAANGVELYAISLQNEPDIEVTYESCDWTKEEMTTFLRDHGDKITATRVIAPESFQFNQEISNHILSDSGAAANVDIIGGHIYGGGLEDNPQARSTGKEVWMTEHLVLESTWTASLATGIEIHDSMTIGNFNAYLWWYVRRFYGPISSVPVANPDPNHPDNEEEPGDARVTKRGYVMSHFARFVRPGYHRVDVTDTPASESVAVSAYTGEKDVIVAINTSSVFPVEISFTLQNGTATQFTPYYTTAAVNAQEGDPVAITDNCFTYILPPGSITTFEGS